MLKLLFHIGSENYVVDYISIEEVIPRINLVPLARAPDHIPGYFIYHGKPVIVVDGSMILQKRPSKKVLHTRIIIFKHAFDQKHCQTLNIGLIAEKVTGLVDKEESDFIDCGYQLKQLPFIGKVCSESSGSMQQFCVQEFFLYFEDYLFLNEDSGAQALLEES